MFTASSPDAQKRLSWTPATVSGRPALIAAVLAMSAPWSPIGETQPRTTSSTRFGSRSTLRPSISCIRPTTRSTGLTECNEPLLLPLPRGVLMASKTSASLAAMDELLGESAGRPARGRFHNNTHRSNQGIPDWVSTLLGVLGFPTVINEKAARTVAGCVAVAGIVALATGAHWLLVPLAYGFWARVLTGPRLSPLAQLATKVVAPRLGAPKEVPGPPKRFAQGMGTAITTLGVVALVLGWTAVTTVLLALLGAAAT